MLKDIITCEECDNSLPKVLLRGANLIQVDTKCQAKVKDVMLKTYKCNKQNCV